jgi:hypothetical protein
VSLAVRRPGPPELPDELKLADAPARISAAACDRDRTPVPAFPEDAFAALEAAGALRVNCSAGPRRPPAEAELDLVRSVARADGSVGRIFDGHLI